MTHREDGGYGQKSETATATSGTWIRSSFGTFSGVVATPMIANFRASRLPSEPSSGGTLAAIAH